MFIMTTLPNPPLSDLHRQRHRLKIDRGVGDVACHDTHAVVGPYMAVQHEGDAAGVERGVREVAPPRTRHRDVDIGWSAGAEARQIPTRPQRQRSRPGRQ